MIHVVALAAALSAGPIVSGEWLQAHLDDPQVRVIYVGSAGDYAKAHIPGARLLDHMETATMGPDGHRLAPNDVLARALDANLRRVGPPAWTVDDVAWMETLSRACDAAAPFALDREIRLHTEGCDPYGQDDGEASWRIPLGRVNWAIPRAVPLHHWGTTALSGHAAGLAGPLMASEALALTAVELLAEPALIFGLEQELAGRVGARDLDVGGEAGAAHRDKLHGARGDDRRVPRGRRACAGRDGVIRTRQHHPADRHRGDEARGDCHSPMKVAGPGAGGRTFQPAAARRARDAPSQPTFHLDFAGEFGGGDQPGFELRALRARQVSRDITRDEPGLFIERLAIQRLHE